MKNKVVSKTNARNNFSDIYRQAKNGETIIVADRGNAYVAVVSIDKLKIEIKKPVESYTNDVFGMWKDRLDIKNKTSVDWVNNKRLERVKETYGTIPNRYKSNS